VEEVKVDNKRNSEKFIGLKAQAEEIKKNYGERFICVD
jgi:predicted DNA-binding WGR domain protein